MAGMSAEMIAKIDAILARVKEPETELSVSDLHLVKRVSYSEKENKFLIVMDIAPSSCACFVGGVVTEHIRASIERNLIEQFGIEFPGIRAEAV